jgi:hypothetical protein
MYNVTKLGFLVDSAISSRHNVVEDPTTGNLVHSFDRSFSTQKYVKLRYMYWCSS